MNKIELYKTAYSPLHEEFVGIRKVRYDDNGRTILDCHVNGYPEDHIHLFRENELTDYVL